MRRFAQKDGESTDGGFIDEKIGQEGIKKIQEDAALKKFIESEKNMIEYCQQLKNFGTGLRAGIVGINVSDPLSITAKVAFLKLCDKLIEIGNDAPAAIKAKNDIVFQTGVLGGLTTIYQPTDKVLKSPSAKRFIPFVGDLINFAYTLTLRPEDFINPIKILLTPYKCDKSHPDPNKPLSIGLPGLPTPNYLDHPELEDQQREKMASVSSLATNLASLIQNVEAALSLIGLLTGNVPFTAAVRIAGGIVEGILTAISIIASPNTYDLGAYAGEDFKGGGIDPSSLYAFLNKIPGLSQYIKSYESKPIAEEAKKASEKIVENFKLLSIGTYNIENGQFVPSEDGRYKIVTLQDPRGDTFTMGIGDEWPKWGIKITGIFTKSNPPRVEYKDKSGNYYSLTVLKNASKEPMSAFTDKNIFDQVMKDAANLSTSGVKGDVDKLLSKTIADIMKLVYQLQSKYPWIGDSKNAKFINLQSDILSHNTKPIKRQKPNVKSVATTPKPTAVPNLREISIDNYKQKYFREDQSQLIPEKRGSAVKVKLQGAIDAIKSGTLSQINWDNWSDIGKQAIIEEAIDRLQNAGFNVLGPTLDYRMMRVPPISKDILNQLSPKYKSLR
jgi:hypothetical protein